MHRRGMKMKEGRYEDSYYATDGRGSRLSRFLNPLLYGLDKWKADSFRSRTGIRSGSILDVGAGDGKFLYFLRQRGLEVHGTTASQVSQKAAQKNFGIQLDFRLHLPPKPRSGPFQAISYWHVFEHLDQPEEHVKRWSRIIAPQGWVMLEVPNIEGLGARICYSSWLGSDEVHHINHMTRGQIETLTKKYGFKVIRAEGFSPKFSYPFLWSALLGRIFGTRTYHFSSVLDLLKEPFLTLRRSPLKTLNGMAAVFYLSPLIILLILSGLISQQPEVLRLYLKQSPDRNAPMP